MRIAPASGRYSAMQGRGTDKKDRAFKGAVNAVIEVPDTVKEEGLLAFEGVTVSYAGKMPEKTYETDGNKTF